MGITKILKGIWRRATTPKKDENYQPKMVSFHKLKVNFIDAVRYDSGHLSNIIIEVTVDLRDDIPVLEAVDRFISIVSVHSGLRMTNMTKKNAYRHYYIAGNVADYMSLMNIYFDDHRLADHRIFRELYNILVHLDITYESLIERLHKIAPEESEGISVDAYTDQLIYYARDLDVSEAIPIRTQFLSDELIEEFDIDLDTIMPMLTSCISYGTDDGYTENMQYIPDFVYTYRVGLEDGFTEAVDLYRGAYERQFEYAPGKNILDINFKVSEDDSPLYGDVDEVLD